MCHRDPCVDTGRRYTAQCGHQRVGVWRGKQILEKVFVTSKKERANTSARDNILCDIVKHDKNPDFEFASNKPIENEGKIRIFE